MRREQGAEDYFEKNDIERRCCPVKCSSVVPSSNEHVLSDDRKSIPEIVSYGIRHNLGVMLCSKSGADTVEGQRTYVS